MATNEKPPAAKIPLDSLKDEALGNLDAMKDELDKASERITAFEEMGMNVDSLKEKINWAYKARDILLKTYGKK